MCNGVLYGRYRNAFLNFHVKYLFSHKIFLENILRDNATKKKNSDFINQKNIKKKLYDFSTNKVHKNGEMLRGQNYNWNEELECCKSD